MTTPIDKKCVYRPGEWKNHDVSDTSKANELTPKTPTPKAEIVTPEILPANTTTPEDVQKARDLSILIDGYCAGRNVCPEPK